MMHYYVPSVVLTGIMEASWHATFLAVMVLGFEFAARKKLPARWRFALWLLVLARLSGVALPESRLSIFNWVPASPVAVRQVAVDSLPAEVLSKELGAKVTTGVASGKRGWVFGRVPGWMDATVEIYILGLAGMGVRIGVSMVRVRGIVKRSRALEDASVRACLAEARRVIGIGREVPLLVSEEMESPALVGWLRPQLVTPARLVGELTMREWEFVFLHECAHLKRNDVLINYWLALLGAVHWFNPMVWMVWPRIRAERELACDEQVILETGDGAEYGETLLKLFDGTGARPAFASPSAVGVIGTKAFFKRRIQMIAAFRRTPAWLAVPLMGVLIVVGAATLTSAVSVAGVRVDLAGPVGSEGVVVKASAEDQILEKEMEKVDVDSLGLSEVIKFLQEKSGANVVVNWKALQNAGVDPNAPVTIHATKVPLRKVLRLALSQMTTANVDFEVDDNVLAISTREDLNTDTMLRVYNVRDLLKRYRTPGSRLLEAVTQPNYPAQNGEAIPAPEESGSFEAAEQEDVGKLKEILMSVDPSSWTVNGGSSGSIVDFHGLLTITTTRTNHAKIEKVLTTLRAADKGK